MTEHTQAYLAARHIEQCLEKKESITDFPPFINTGEYYTSVKELEMFDQLTHDERVELSGEKTPDGFYILNFWASVWVYHDLLQDWVQVYAGNTWNSDLSWNPDAVKHNEYLIYCGDECDYSLYKKVEQTNQSKRKVLPIYNLKRGETFVYNNDIFRLTESPDGLTDLINNMIECHRIGWKDVQTNRLVIVDGHIKSFHVDTLVSRVYLDLQ